ncbi:conserved hypothetical protein [Solidesulfovibrio fructosivorans JJ]]|uniref:Uncharacterized protein n=1 Tax=Solidesulfovibrio fructosivorans JJ] TaxID=596151 RepID=E1JYW6_SOLFR|nr:hypothetical protein [Solidesulfovibrio fructosivorans]EFL50382.1 conserved hypothetical protein [Solidesulfovibrio fructosivorans JJ]]
MRSLLWALVLTGLLCGVPARAAQSVTLDGRVSGVMQYPETQTICLSFTSNEKKQYMICDDVTAKEVIEQLFALGKKDAPCRIEGAVAKKSGDDVYLSVTRVTQGK